MSNQTKTNIFATLALSVFPLIFTACGDETTENITQINQTDIEVVSSTKELPKCTKDNVGQQAFVKGESSTLICVDNKWVATASSGKDTVIIKETSNCTTKELKDKSGVKIVCNGDSVGVVLNGKNGTKGDKGDTGAAGKDGTNGKNGAGCTVVTLADNSGLKVVCGGDSVGVVLNGKQGEKGDPGTAGKQGEKGDAGTGCTIAQDTSKITITCGDKSSTINLNDIGTSIADTAVVDSEKVAVSLDSLAGYTQKGPFIKGSTVYLYELMDGRSLKQTNGSFTSNITRDDGRFKFTARDLVSQYVMLIVDGNYRNEVTGKTSNSAIRLKAYSDVRRHATGTVNVNILTHLEFDRVYYLVTREKMTMKNAKRQAQQEIRKQFYIEQSDNTDAENLDVFGKTDADAALLAISILLQGERSEPEMMALLTEISNDMETDGKWNGTSSDSVKAAIALWAMNNHGRLREFRNNVKSWGLGEAPAFEKHIDNFIEKSFGSVDCYGKKNGYKETVNKKFSPYDGKSFVCNDGVAVMERPEKTHFNPNINYGEMIDMRDHKVYKTVDIGTQTWMAENLDFTDTLAYPALKTEMQCFDNKKENCEKYGRFYSYAVAIDSFLIYGDGAKDCALGKNASNCRYNYPVRGICPEGWHLPNADEWRLLWVNVGSTKALLSKNASGTDDFGFSAIHTGYYSGSYSIYDEVYWWEMPYMGYYYMFIRLYDDWVLDLSSEYIAPSNANYFAGSGSSKLLVPIRCLKDKDFDYGSFTDERDNHQYKTIEIGGKTWMAENLNYKPGDDSDTSSFCLNEDPTNCDKYGRYYYKDSIQSVCPKGWHLPDSTEWLNVFYAHGRSSQAMQTMSMHATNTLGLGLLPMHPNDRVRGSLNTQGGCEGAFVWSDGGYVIWTTCPATNLPNAHADYRTDSYYDGFPVRCVKDDK